MADEVAVIKNDQGIICKFCKSKILPKNSSTLLADKEVSTIFFLFQTSYFILLMTL